jgi:hypothetical protein
MAPGPRPVAQARGDQRVAPTLWPVPAEIEPPELARLLEFAERPRTEDWSLRAALTRYAQPQPQRVSDVLELVRRVEFAVRPHLKSIDRDGGGYWQALRSADSTGPVDPIVGLLGVMVDLDRLGDVLAEWAADPSRERPDAAVDAVTADVARRLDALGVPREERQRPTRSRA